MFAFLLLARIDYWWMIRYDDSGKPVIAKPREYFFDSDLTDGQLLVRKHLHTCCLVIIAVCRPHCSCFPLLLRAAVLTSMRLAAAVGGGRDHYLPTACASPVRHGAASDVHTHASHGLADTARAFAATTRLELLGRAKAWLYTH